MSHPYVGWMRKVSPGGQRGPWQRVTEGHGEREVAKALEELRCLPPWSEFLMVERTALKAGDIPNPKRRRKAG